MNKGKLRFFRFYIQLIHSFIIEDLPGVYRFSSFFQARVLYRVIMLSLSDCGFRDHIDDSSVTFEKSPKIQYVFSVFRSKQFSKGEPFKFFKYKGISYPKLIPSFVCSQFLLISKN
jgi:hypothetical protein